MHAYMGAPTSRIDGVAKVTGAAKYAGEFNAPGLAHACMVGATIAKGRITRIDTSAAKSVAGVIDVLTHENRPPLPDNDQAYKDDVAPDGSPFRPLYDGKVMFNGQPIALVVAETPEIARFAAALVEVDYSKEASVTDIFSARDKAVPARSTEPGMAPPKARGTPDQALAAAAVRHEAEYFVPIEHHNPMELYASTVVYEDGGKLTVYDKTQGVQNVQKYLCGVFGMKPEEVRVMSPFMGGGFGSGLRPQFQVMLAALAARALQRSVRLVLTRQQMYVLGYRPAMIQSIALGANTGGTLDAITHDAVTITSQYEDFHRQETGWSGVLYKSPNAKYAHRLAKLDLATSCDMRAPSAATALFALEFGDGRARHQAEARSGRAAPALLYGSRPDRGQAVQQQGAAGVLSAGCGGVRLEQAQPRAALDARRQRPGRLGHGDGRVGGAAGADHGAHRADGQRPCRGGVRDLRHRHRHLHHHGAGGGRHAGPAARQHLHQARRLEPAAVAGRGRIVDRDLGGECDRGDGGAGARRSVARRRGDAELAARRPRGGRRGAGRRQAGKPARRRPRGVDRRCDASRGHGPHRQGTHHQPLAGPFPVAQNAFGGVCRGEGGRAAGRRSA